MPRYFDEEDKNHLKKMNHEFGEMCTRVGRLEGKIDGGFGALNSNLKFIERKFDSLPCGTHAEVMKDNLKMINLNIGKINTMEGREWAWSKIRYLFMAALFGALMTLIFTHTQDILLALGI